MEPLVTIGIPTLNRAAYLVEAVTSVLEQSYPTIEVLVVDNGSTDGTPAALAEIRDERLRVIRFPDTSPMRENWDRTLDQARGEYFLLLSDDDLLVPDAIQRMAEPLRDEGISFSYGRFLEIDQGGAPTKTIGLTAPVREPGEDFIQGTLSGLRGAMPSGLLFRRNRAMELGGFPPVGTATDLALRLALATGGDVAFCPEPVVHYRRHSAGLSASAVPKLIESHQQLLAWVKKKDGPLVPYADMVQHYVGGWFVQKAQECAIAGDRAGAEAFLAEGAVLGADLERSTIIRAHLNPFSRPLLSALRWLRGLG